MADAPVPKASEVRFEGVTPILAVRDLAASIDHYVRVLGFHLDWKAAGGLFASVSRGRCAIFLSQGDQGHAGTWIWVGVEDVDALHDGYIRSGARLRHPPTNYPWGREMQVEDPDGNVLRIGSDARAGIPFGEWLDMNGQRWMPTPDGKWRRVPT